MERNEKHARKTGHRPACWVCKLSSEDNFLSRMRSSGIELIYKTLFPWLSIGKDPFILAIANFKNVHVNLTSRQRELISLARHLAVTGDPATCSKCSRLVTYTVMSKSRIVSGVSDPFFKAKQKGSSRKGSKWDLVICFEGSTFRPWFWWNIDLSVIRIELELLITINIPNSMLSQNIETSKHA